MTSPGVGTLVVGAGVMGCSIALDLARRGRPVLVLERSVPGAEASSAAAGMLGAQVESHAPGPFTSLCVASRERFGRWATILRELTGIDVEHRACGITRVALSAQELEEVGAHASWQRDAGLRAVPLGRDELARLEPRASPRAVGGVHFPDDGRVDPPRLLAALRIGAERAGATFRTGTIVRRVVVDGEGARGVTLESGEEIAADDVVVAAGSWTTLVGGTPLEAGAVRPARGQIVELSTPRPILGGAIVGARAYLSPRDDGRLLVGSTLEFVGFERGVTAGAVQELLAAAVELVPDLAGAAFGRAWSSFRPYTASELPIIGESPVRRLWLATGHYRNGILLGPVTAEILGALIVGEAPPVDPTPFRAPGA